MHEGRHDGMRAEKKMDVSSFSRSPPVVASRLGPSLTVLERIEHDEPPAQPRFTASTIACSAGFG